MFILIRLLIGIALLMCSLIILKKSRIKDKRLWVFAAIGIFTTLTAISGYMPIENLFLHFESAESAYTYYQGSSDIECVVEGNICDLVVNQKGSSYANIVMPKTEDGWKIGMSSDTKAKKVYFEDSIYVMIYQYENTNEYFIMVVDIDGGESSVSDEYGTVFYSFTSDVGFVTNCAYLPNYSAQYCITVNGERIKTNGGQGDGLREP